MADWGKKWKTMDKSFEIKQLEVFQEMVKRGLIFRRYKPVYWSPSSRTALAEAELEYKNDHESTAAYIAFPIVSLPDGLKTKLGNITTLSALIWTTTPWTLPANRAIAFHSNMEYSVARTGNERLILVAKSRLDAVKAFFEGEFEIVVDSIWGQELEGATYMNPLRGKVCGLRADLSIFV